MSPGDAWNRSTPTSANRWMPVDVIRSPQFMASFSKTRFGRVPTSFGASGLRTSYTLIESMLETTNSGLVLRKHPEMPAEPGSVLT